MPLSPPLHRPVTDAAEPVAVGLARPALHRETLDNGLVLILQEDHTAPLLTLQAWFKAGAIHENELLGCGMSHFVEHMLFKGTRRRGVGQFARDIAAAGGDLNAYTHFDRTVFHVHVRSDFFDAALDALADVIQHSTFPPEETEKEQEVILNELKSYLDNPDRVAHYLFHETLYHVHPFRFPIGGLVDQFRRLSREDLVRYYEKVYVPNNMLFVAVGDFRIPEALPKVRAAFEPYARKPLPPIYIPAEPRQTAPRTAIREFRTRVAKLRIGWHTVAISHPDLFPLDVMASILGGGNASRLTRVLRDRKGLVFDIDAGNHTPNDPGYFYVAANLDAANVDAARAAVLEEVHEFGLEPVTAEELASAKNRVEADFYYKRQTIEGQADALGVSEILTGGIGFDEVYLEGIRRVTPAEIQRVARTYFSDENLTVTALVPLSPPTVPQAGAAAPAATEGRGGPARARIPAACRFRLENGATICGVENHKLPIVSAYATFLGGARFESPDKNGVSNLMADLLTRGTKTRAAEEIARSIESVGGVIDSVSGKNAFGLRLTVLKKDLDLGLDVLADCLANPAFAEKELEQVRQEVLSAIRLKTDQVWDANSILFSKLFYGAHPYGLYPLGTLETVEKLSREDLRAFHARHCVPSNMVLALAGDLTAAEAEAAVRKAFGGFAGGPADPPAIGPVPDLVSAVREVRELPDKNLAAVLWGFKTVAFHHPDRYPLEVLQNLLSKMGGRLFVHLRDEKALAYNVGCFSAVNLDPGYFGFYIMAQPHNVEPAVAAMREEIEVLKRELVSEEELATAKSTVIGGAMSDLQTNSSQAQSVALDQLYGLGYLEHFHLPERIAEVSREEILRVARTYFDLNRSLLTITRPGAALTAVAVAQA
ncbi:MAG: insulinase family protein [Planctomycetes bacterium]|nr:insulinase family protein [Planctomycetota bacterium]